MSRRACVLVPFPCEGHPDCPCSAADLFLMSGAEDELFPMCSACVRLLRRARRDRDFETFDLTRENVREALRQTLRARHEREGSRARARLFLAWLREDAYVSAGRAA